MIGLLAVLSLVADDPPIQVPAGYTVEKVAGPPLVERPIMASFDDHGRLYVADSTGANLKGSELLKDPPHRIRLLEDTDGDGKFDTSRVWADRLVFPQGLLWHDGAVYITSPPGFWKLEDTDGDGVCDKRSELVTGFANTGVADDAHGACLGPDGRIYFLPGRMAHDIRYPDGTPIKKATGPWLMRMRPDGKDVEIVCGTIGNPVEVDWTPEGDYFISGTFWAPDSFGGGLRDALIHGLEGGEYAVRDRIYNDRKRTGDFLPVMVPMVATAPSGMMIYRSGGEFSGNLFCTYFNTRKVLRHVLERDGATWRSRNEEFAGSAHADFHPTDVLEDADGSVLVVDTGGWFRIGCPTSQIAKPQVLGGLYRIRRKDAPPVADARGRKATMEVAALDDPRFVVRERAMRELAKGRAADVAGALKSESARMRLNAVWTLTRMEGAEARARVRSALGDGDAGVRQAAVTSVGLHRDAEAAGRLAGLVASDTPPIRREAAAALGRLLDRRGVTAILAAVAAAPDRYLEHALVYALIRIADREAMTAALRDTRATVRRAALIALDQMEGGNLTQDLVTPLLDPTDVALQQAALKVILARPAWAKEIFGLVRQWISEPSLDEGRREVLRGVVVAFARDPQLQDLVALALREGRSPVATRLLLLEAMGRTPLERLPSTWLAEARWALDHEDEAVLRQAVVLIRSAGSADFDDALARIARDGARGPEVRVEALAVAAPRLAKLDAGLFKLLVDGLDGGKAPLHRLAAAEALGQSPLDDGQLEALARTLRQVGALELPRMIGAFHRSKSGSLGKKLLAALEAAPALESLTVDVLRGALAGFPEEVRAQAAPLLKKLEGDTEQQKARLAELAGAAAGGDPPRGREVFLGRKAGCTACHTVQGQGGKVGPDLSKIGSIRAGRDLLEAIVFPSATFARGFEPFLVRTKEGAILDGLVTRETPDAIYLFLSDRTEKRIARSSIDAIQQGRLSAMPQGLDSQLTREELRDLIGFLMSLK